ncbi:hypothetical protein [Neisseria zalophi]|uniref:Lipoprotein n=1 Tax=Neisseria zalophi TaxID=640030 RepID=A0A5J6PY93_9NEIS|nr:hypothetical protein [Neisseria zalophi]QEY25872.1 hypothetical protein D0T92_04530 [Neisseria zalophi]
MNIIQTTVILSAALSLAACAITPEQKAAREAARIRYEQDLQVSLAAQCDRDAANLMREQFSNRPRSEKEQKEFRARYVDKISDPLFQACYKLAWQNHIAQQRLERMRYYHDWDDFYYPFHRRYCYYCW